MYVRPPHIAEYGMDQPGKVVSPAGGQLNSKDGYFPVSVGV